MMNLKRRREEEEETECFYGHGETWLRGMKVAEESSGTLYDAVRYKPRPKNPRVFDHNIAPGTLTVKSAIDDSDLIQEANVLDNLHGCSYIRQMLGEELTRSSDKSGNLVTNLLLEFCFGGNLVRLMNEAGGMGFPEPTVRLYTSHILMGLARVHEEGYVYGGLKPDNVILALNRDFINDGGDDENECLNKYKAKLGDFGLAEKVDERREGRGSIGIKYMAPETLVGDVKDMYSDIWALGCVVVEMVQGYSIWEGAKDSEIEEILYGVEEGRKEGNFVFENLSYEGKDFLEKCLVRREERWSARMLLNHPFVIREVLEYDDMTERALEAVEEAVEEVKNSGHGGVLEAAKEVLEAAKEVVEAVKEIERFKEMWGLTMSGDFIPLEDQEEEEGGAVEDDMSELELKKEEAESEVNVDDEDAYGIIPSFQKKNKIANFEAWNGM